MEIYINECSFHEQFFDRSELNNALKVFFSILNIIKDIQNEFSFYSDENLLHVYKAISDEVLIASLNKYPDKELGNEVLKDGDNLNKSPNKGLGDEVLINSLNKYPNKGLDTAVIDLLKNKIKAKDWKNEQLHSVDDIFVCDKEVVTETSIAELAERILRDNKLLAIIINFSNSKYKNKNVLEVTKNEGDSCNLSCVEEKGQIEEWLSQALDIADNNYDYNSTDTPRDHQTVLKNLLGFKKTGQVQSGRMIYRELETGYYWYVDNLHVGKAAHLEVFDSQGKHIGEAALSGEIDTNKQDRNKQIDV